MAPQHERGRSRPTFTERLAMPTTSSPEDPFLELLKENLPAALPEFLVKQRWFGAKARTISSVEVSDIIPFHSDSLRSYFHSCPRQLHHRTRRDL